MSSRLASVRADEAEIAVWVEVAGRLGLAFNRWARRALNDQVDLDLALLRELEEGSLDGGGRVE